MFLLFDMVRNKQKLTRNAIELCIRVAQLDQTECCEKNYSHCVQLCKSIESSAFSYLNLNSNRASNRRHEISYIIKKRNIFVSIIVSFVLPCCFFWILSVLTLCLDSLPLLIHKINGICYSDACISYLHADTIVCIRRTRTKCPFVCYLFILPYIFKSFQTPFSFVSHSTNKFNEKLENATKFFIISILVRVFKLHKQRLEIEKQQT